MSTFRAPSKFDGRIRENRSIKEKTLFSFIISLKKRTPVVSSFVFFHPLFLLLLLFCPIEFQPQTNMSTTTACNDVPCNNDGNNRDIIRAILQQRHRGDGRVSPLDSSLTMSSAAAAAAAGSTPLEQGVVNLSSLNGRDTTTQHDGIALLSRRERILQIMEEVIDILNEPI